jgi:hypothetical protein
MIDSILESLGEAAEAAAEIGAEVVGENVVEIVGDGVTKVVGMAEDAVLPDRNESSEEHDSSETESSLDD